LSENSKKGLFFVILLPIIWGTTFAIVKEALADISPLLYNVLRFSLASLIFSAFAAGREGLRILLFPRTDLERALRRDALILGLALGGGYATQTVGLESTTSSKSAFITSTTIIWTPLFSALLGKEKMRLPLLISIIVTLIGTVLLTHPYKEGTGINMGDFLTLICAWCFGVYIIKIESALPKAEEFFKKRGTQDKGSALAGIMVTEMQLTVSAFVIFLAMLIAEQPYFHNRPTGIVSFIYTGLFATALTAYWQTRYQQAVTPSVASVIFMLEPVVALILGYFFLSERMGTEEIIGALLIVVGVVIAQLKLPTTNENRQ